MFRKAIVSAALGLAISAQAQDVGQGVFVDVFDDFVAFELESGNADMQLRISGPKGYFRSENHPGNQPAYVEVNPYGGSNLEDGLYKYEIIAIPLVAYSREESSAMPDRNRLIGKTSPKVSPTSGSFRVLNGRIVDESMPEAGASAK